MLKAMGRGIYKKEPMLGARSLVRFLVGRQGDSQMFIFEQTPGDNPHQNSRLKFSS